MLEAGPLATESLDDVKAYRSSQAPHVTNPLTPRRTFSAV